MHCPIEVAVASQGLGKAIGPNLEFAPLRIRESVEIGGRLHVAGIVAAMRRYFTGFSVTCRTSITAAAFFLSGLIASV